VALLTPVAKAFSTDVGNEVASLGVQVHGGMGFIEETGVAQYMRDARIAAIYEGTNGIQAIDLVQRKLGLSGGDVMRREIADMRRIVDDVANSDANTFGLTAQRLREAVDSLERAGEWMARNIGSSPDDALAGATPFLRLFGIARSGTSLATMAVAARRLAQAGDSDPAHAERIALARFFAENVAVAAPGLELTVTQGAASVNGFSAVLEADR
jgi:acyl-CoA dehydrogenase